MEAARAVRKAFAAYLALPAVDLSRPIVVKIRDALTRSGSPVMAEQTMTYGRACYAWALKRGMADNNPFAGLPKLPTIRRERVLSDDELAALWRATEGGGPFNSIVRALVLTGQRRDECAGMTWAEITPDSAIWEIAASRTKNGKPNLVPLSEPMRELLRGIPRSGDLVFESVRGAFSGWSKSKAQLDKRSGVADWRLHDLRRTAATGLQKLGVRLEVTEAILNHVSGTRGGIAGVYQRHDWLAEKRAAIEAWGAHVAAIVSGESASN